MTASKSSREPAIVAGRYVLAHQVATGGMASVHLGHDRVLDRPVAVKILHPGFATDPVFVSRFRQEAQAAGRLNHPRVVAVYDWGRHENSYYIAMEYVDGQTLAELLQDTGPLPVGQAVGITLDVLGALDAAHGRGLVHRDIKPANLIVGSSGTKVADFGIMRAYKGDDEADEIGSIIGTASYMSPEQAQGLAVDPRSDLYSLGVVLFEMLTGRRPFMADSPVAIALQHLDQVPPKITSIRAELPPALEAVVERLLAKDPDDRFASAAEVRASVIPLREADGHGHDAPTTLIQEARTAIMPTASLPDRDGGPRPPSQTATPEPAPPQTATSEAAPPQTATPEAAPPRTTPPQKPAPTTLPTAPAHPARSSGRVPVVAAAVLVAAVVGLLLLAAVQIGQGDGQDEADGAEPAAPTSSVPTTDDIEGDDVATPDLVGETRSEAQRLLRDLGLSARVSEVTVDDPDLDGVVVGQDPDADDPLESGGVVAIEVGRFEDTSTTTSTTVSSSTTSTSRATSASTTASTSASTVRPSTTRQPTSTTAAPTTSGP